MRFGHEYRFTLGLIGVMFIISGLIDALSEDFTVKYFITLALLAILWWVGLYEMIWYPTPRNPLMESLLLLVALVSAGLGVHGTVWIFVSILVGREITDPVWLAPNVEMPRTAFYAMTFITLAVYLAILIAANLFSDELDRPGR